MRRNPARRSVRERLAERELRRLHVKVGRAFGRHLRTLRERAGLSQGDLAGATYDRSFIAKLESGASLPSLETIDRIAAVLRIRPRRLIPKEL
jgi:ribosome-binding protein aMBF1 (putative translation factor)